MPYLFLVISVFCMASSSVCGGYFNRRTANNKDQTALFNFIRTLCMLIFYCVYYAFDFSFDPKVLLYSLAIGVGFSLCTVAYIYALKNGTVALTSLVFQSSLIGVTIWGLIFWNAPLTVTVGLGIGLVAVGLALCILSPKKAEEKNKTVSFKWFLWAFLAFLGNAVSTIAQREQQIAFDGKHGSMLMVFALLIATIFCFILFLKSDRSESKLVFKKHWAFPVSAGIMNALLNVFVIILATSELSPSLIYPVLAVGGLMVSMLFSLFAFKEKLKWWQWVGFLIGAVAIALINL